MAYTTVLLFIRAVVATLLVLALLQKLLGFRRYVEEVESLAVFPSSVARKLAPLAAALEGVALVGILAGQPLIRWAFGLFAALVVTYAVTTYVAARRNKRAECNCFLGVSATISPLTLARNIVITLLCATGAYLSTMAPVPSPGLLHAWEVLGLVVMGALCGHLVTRIPFIQRANWGGN